MTSCQHILDGHFDHGDVTEVIEFNGIILMRCISCVILFALILKNKYRASREDGRRAMLLLLPSYYPVIGFVIFYYFLFALLHIFIRGYGRYLVLVALDVAINHAMGVGLSFFLMQHGAGVYAFQRSLLFALAFCVLGFFAFYFIAKSSSGQRHDDHSHVSQRSYFAHIIFSCLILAFYSLVTFIPREYLYRRPAIYKYAKYCIVENFVWIVASSLMYVEHNAGYCALLSSKVILVSILHPVFFVHCLAKDSEVTLSHVFKCVLITSGIICTVLARLLCSAWRPEPRPRHLGFEPCVCQHHWNCSIGHATQCQIVAGNSLQQH